MTDGIIPSYIDKGWIAETAVVIREMTSDFFGGKSLKFK